MSRIKNNNNKCVCVCTENSMVAEGEISDGELTDLLAEGDDAAFVSSRLRPSTLNRQHSVAERRHSRRIQSRTRTRTSGVIPNSLRHTSGVRG